MKKFFLVIFFLIFLFSCQNREISQNFSEKNQSENFKNEPYNPSNFLGFQIFFENKESEIFSTFDEMEKIFEKNNQKITGFGDVTAVHDDDIASMPDFLVIKIIEKILENPEKISENFRIAGLQKSQIYDEDIFEKISELPVKNLEFSMFYISINDMNENFLKKISQKNFENVKFHSFENCDFLLENGEKTQKITYNNTTFIC